MEHCGRNVEINSFEHVNIVHVDSMNEFYATAVSARHRKYQLLHILLNSTYLIF